MRTRKRFLSTLLTLALLLSLLPANALADNEDPAVESTEETVEFTVIPDLEDLPDNNELLMGYFQKQLFGNDDIATFGIACGDRLPEKQQFIYYTLKTGIKKVADGEQNTTVFIVDATDAKITSENFDAAANSIITALLFDCPYEFYWYDKTAGTEMGGSLGSDGNISTITFKFTVAQAYRAAGEDLYAADTVKTSAAKIAASNANAIVTDNGSETDYKKLVAYRDKICELVSYNHDATADGVAYGDPWQLIYVFDGNSSTNVVCEGYAKAFQYLCDLSTFKDDVTCYTVTGTMDDNPSDEIAGGAHMWNIVTMEDGKNYLVDVTNCDEGTVGYPDKLFLAGTGGSVSEGYTFGSVLYKYGDENPPYGDILILSTENYKIPITGLTVTGLDTPETGATPDTTATVKASAANGATNLDVTVGSVKWYNGGTELGSGTFAPSTEYTAKLTVTAPTGYRFTDTTSCTGFTVTPTETGATLSKDFTTGANPALTGTVSISGTPQIGKPLTATTTDIPDGSGTLTYKWYRVNGGTATEISGQTSATYTPNTADDVGKTIKVEVSAANYSGSLSATTESSVVKADGPAAPTAPTVKNQTINGFTYEAVADQQYAVTDSATAPANSDWGEKVTTGSDVAVTGKTAGTTYYVHTRVAETDTVKAGSSIYTEVKTLAAPVPSDFTYSTTSATYTGAANPAPVTSDKHGSNFTLKYNGSTDIPTNAGTYTLTADVAAHDGYAAQTVALGNWTIDPASVTLTWSDTDLTYNGSAQAPTVSVASGAVSGETVTVAVTDDSKKTDASDSSYTATAKITGVTSGQGNAANYTISNATQTFTIGKANITVDGDAFTNCSAVYDRNAHTIGYNDTKVTTAGSQSVAVQYSTDGSTWSDTAPTYTNVGTATVHWKLSAPNHNDASGTATVTISQKDISASGVDKTATLIKKVNTFNDPEIDGVNGEKVSGTFSYSYDSKTDKGAIEAALAAKEPGTYPVGFTFTPSGNYTGSITGTLSVSVKDIEFKVGTETASVTNALTIKSSPTYGDTWAEIITITGNITAVVDTTPVAGSYSLEQTGSPSVGNGQTFRVLFNSSDEAHTYTNVVVCSGTVDVAAKSISGATVTVNGTYVYNKSAQVPDTTNITVKVNGKTLTSGTDYTFEASNNTNAGTATVTVTGTGNYTDTATGTFAISAKPIEEADFTTLGTENKTYTGEALTQTITSGLTLNTDYTVEYANNVNVGTNTAKYTIKGKGNYNGSFEKTFTIAPATVTVTPSSSQSKTYGDSDPELTYTTSPESLAAGNAITGALSRAEGENVGTYAINLGTLSAGSNYKVELASGTVNFTINAKNVTEARAAEEKNVVKNVGDFTQPTFGDVTGTLKYTYNSTEYNDYNALKTVLGALGTGTTGTISYTYTAIGNYSGTITGSINFTVVDIEFKVGTTPASADNAITTLIANTEYGKTWQDRISVKSDVITASVDGVTKSGTYTIVPESGSLTDRPGVGAKNYTVKFTGDGYTDVTVFTGSITVTAKSVTITGLTASDKEYDGNATASVSGTAMVSGKVGTDDLTVTPGTAAFDNKNVGTNKTVTFNGYSLSGAAAANYQLTGQPASVTASIIAKPVTVTGISAVGRAYENGNKEVNLTGTGAVDGMVTGDTVTVSLEGAKGTMDTADAGENKALTVTGVTLISTDAANYALTQPTGLKVTITKAAARTLDDISVSQKYTVTTAQTKAIGRAGMPADAGTLTYTKGTETTTGTVTVSSWNVDASGNVTFTLTGGVEGATVTLPVKINSTNYAESTVNVKITLTAKDAQAFAAGFDAAVTKTYGGGDFTKAATLSVGNGAVTYASSDTSVATVDNTGKVHIVKVGTATITATAAATDDYAQATASYKLTVNKASITITAGSKSAYVGDAVPTLSSSDYTVTGLASGDSLATAPTVAYASTPDMTKAGTVAIKASGAAVPTGGNYNDTITYVDGTLTISSRPYYGGGSSSSSNTTTTTTTNRDGSTTTTTTNKTTGTVTEVTKEKDGTTTTVETKKDGTVTETVKTTNGTTGTVVTDKNGDVTEVKSTVSSTAAREAAKTGEAVTLPVEVPAAKTTEDAPAVQVTVPKASGSVKVEIPVEKVTPGTVAVIVNADGTEKIVSTSMTTENGVALTISGAETVKIIDNSKSFTDVPKSNVFYNEIASLSAREIMVGKTDDKFDLHNSVTLNQIANVAGRIVGAVDVKDYNAGIAWGAEYGLKTGNVAATRGDVLKALYIAAGSPIVADTSVLARFNDAGSIPADLMAAAAWAAQSGILKGNVDGSAGLGNNVTRGQACALAGRTMGTLA